MTAIEVPTYLSFVGLPAFEGQHRPAPPVDENWTIPIQRLHRSLRPEMLFGLVPDNKDRWATVDHEERQALKLVRKAGGQELACESERRAFGQRGPGRALLCLLDPQQIWFEVQHFVGAMSYSNPDEAQVVE